MRIRRLIAAASLCTLLAACDSPAKIEVEPKMPMLQNTEKTLKLKVTVKDKSGKVLPGAKYTFQALTPTLLSVDSTGSVRASQSGVGAVLVSVGKLTKKVEISIQIPKRIGIDPDSPTLNVGLRKNIKATLYNDRGKAMLAAGPVTWTSSDPEVVSIDKDGMIKTIKEGKATITARASGISGTTVITVEHEKMQADGYLGHGK